MDSFVEERSCDFAVIGSGSGNAAFAVRPDARGSRAFAALLRECSEMRENRHVSGDEFQYAWYLYGLEHYGGMPLIEPLEYSEERRLRGAGGDPDAGGPVF